MASTKKPNVIQQTTPSEKITEITTKINNVESEISELKSENVVIENELDTQKKKLADDIKRKQDAITEIFNKRSKNLEIKRLILVNDVYKKHGKRFGNKTKLNEKSYDDLVELLKIDKKSIWCAFKKMLNL